MERAEGQTSAESRQGSLSALRRGLVARYGLRGKLLVSFVLLLLVALATSSSLFVSKSREALSDILGEQARQISQTLAMAAGTPAVMDHPAELQRLGKELLKSRNIVLVGFYDASGRPVAVSCRDPELTLSRWQAAPDVGTNTQNLMQVRTRWIASLGNFLQVTAPVFDIMPNGDAQEPHESRTRLLGYLTVGVSQIQEQNQIQRVSLLGITVGFVVFCLTLPLASGLVHRIINPIRDLVDATRRIAAGNYDIKVETQRPDEIGHLARSFNEMVGRIREHQHALRLANESLAESNRGLEEKVLQRTRELRAANDRLSAEIAEKEDFLRAVSHDLNAPLRNISGMASMLLLKYREKFDEEVVHRLERIRKNVEVETDLIAELLELSRIKTRRQKLEKVDVDAMVRDLGGVFEDDLKQRGISLIVDNPLPPLLGEKARLRQVFQNLIDNSIKYMGEGDTREIHVGWEAEEDGVEFYVRDTGVGIDKDDLPKVFYIFRRGKNSAEAKVPGKGVGLASVKSIIETYNGRIRVESEVGVGSVFRFTIHRDFVPALRPQDIEGGASPALLTIG